MANEAAKNVREAAEAAQKAEEKAGNKAASVAAEKPAQFEQKANEAMQLVELLKLVIMDAVSALEMRISGKIL